MPHPENCSYDTDALAEAHAHTLRNRTDHLTLLPDSTLLSAN